MFKVQGSRFNVLGLTFPFLRQRLGDHPNPNLEP
jgi:hypothetical protein